jgi:hypothetical protein
MRSIQESPASQFQITTAKKYQQPEEEPSCSHEVARRPTTEEEAEERDQDGYWRVTFVEESQYLEPATPSHGEVQDYSDETVLAREDLGAQLPEDQQAYKGEFCNRDVSELLLTSENPADEQSKALIPDVKRGFRERERGLEPSRVRSKSMDTDRASVAASWATSVTYATCGGSLVPGRRILGVPWPIADELKNPEPQEIITSTLPSFRRRLSAALSPKSLREDLAPRLCEVAASHELQFTALSATGGALTLGVSGGAAGCICCGIFGAAVGVVPALFTFGLSIPFGAAVGGGIGLCAGTATGAGVGFVGGGAFGYGAYKLAKSPERR